MSNENSEKNTIYQRQIENIFDRPTDKSSWKWQPVHIIGLFDADANTVFDFMERLLLDLKTDLSPYNADQIAGGIGYIFNNSLSNYTHDFKNAEVEPERRERVLLSMFNLWRDIFNPMCQNKTSSGEKTIISELNNTCYMFWDNTPLATWADKKEKAVSATEYFNTFSEEDFKNMMLPEGVLEVILQAKAQTKSPVLQKTSEEVFLEMQTQLTDINSENKHYYKAVANVMKQSLYLPNPACVESGLHGLGHMATFQSKIAVPIIDEFLKNPKTSNKHLIEYALQARTGMIQ